MASNLAAELIGNADLVLVLGASLTQWTTRHGTIFNSYATIVQCDDRREALGERMPITFGVVADVGQLAHALLRALEADGYRATGFRGPDVARRIAEAAAGSEVEAVSTCTAVDPRSLTRTLDRLIPRARTIVQDGGHFCGWGPTLMSAPDGRGFDWGQSFMSVGLGIGAAIGAAIGRPERRTVLLTGDGGAMMSLGDYESAVRLRAPILVVVFNDAAYGAEVGILEALALPTTPAIFGDVDIAALARTLGFRAQTIRNVRELDGVANEIADPRCALLLDCKVDPNLRADWFEREFGKGGVQLEGDPSRPT
jgi:thiamine pyrophosphate-dependent acetolactate synthase large subunit-like protein